MRRIAEQLAESSFGAEIERHEDLDGNAAASVVEFVDADDSAQGFLIEGAGGVGIGEGDEDAQTFLIFAVLGDEVYAVLRGVLGGEDFIEIGEAGFGRAHADNPRKFQPALAPTFFCFQARHVPLCA